jgi:glycosyltransferase involved in cell wall biosynthesis
MTVSVLLLTLNEEVNLPSFFKSLNWCDDIVVIDSFSSDNTVNLAKQNNAKVYQRKFDNFADQRNYALENISFKYDWILHLDADEIITPELYAEIKREVNSEQYDAFKIPSKIMFFGKWLRYAATYPVFQVRLARRKKLRFKKYGHGQRENLPPKKIGTIMEPYLHYTFSKGFKDWFDKHNRYSTDEAIATLSAKSSVSSIDLIGCFSLDQTKRRRALKLLSFYLPFRPSLRFIYMYFFCLGFLDGYEGLLYCRLLAYYEKMIILKVRMMSYVNKKDHD